MEQIHKPTMITQNNSFDAFPRVAEMLTDGHANSSIVRWLFSKGKTAITVVDKISGVVQTTIRWTGPRGKKMTQSAARIDFGGYTAVIRKPLSLSKLCKLATNEEAREQFLRSIVANNPEE